MPTLGDIRRRIKAVKNTRQITRAMKMVAAAKLRRAQQRMLALRPYAHKMQEVLASLAQVGGAEELHPLRRRRPRKVVEVLVLTSDRGLCGAFNSNVLRAATALLRDFRDKDFQVSASAVGRKAVEYYKRREVPLRAQWTGISGRLGYAHAQEIASNIIEGYLKEDFDELYLVYNEFKSVIAQKVSTLRLLPLHEPEEAQAMAMADYIFEPSARALYEQLLPKALEIQLYRALLESQASEEAARMTAMENASKNADEMIDRLTLVANKVRQATITKELMDIVGGAEALK